MKINMKDVLAMWHTAERKKPVLILTFPIAQKMGVTVTEILHDPDKYVEGMKLLANDPKMDMWALLTYMDLSVEAEAFGGEVAFADDDVPNIVKPVIPSTMEAVEALQVPAVGTGRTGLYLDACRRTVEEINNPDLPVLAGCIGPFSLAGRIMDIQDILMNTVMNPEMVHALLEKCTQFIIEYVKAYKEAGANGIAMAEPLAGLLAPKQLRKFSSEYVKRIVDAVQDDHFAVLLHNCGSNTIKAAEHIYYTGAAGYHFGNVIDMEKMCEVFPDDAIVMGNIDPAGRFCMGTPETMREDVLDVMGKCCGHKNFIISSGCDIPGQTPWENIYAFFDAVNEYYGD